MSFGALRRKRSDPEGPVVDADHARSGGEPQPEWFRPVTAASPSYPDDEAHAGRATSTDVERRDVPRARDLVVAGFAAHLTVGI